jgi:hypothetical protein
MADLRLGLDATELKSRAEKAGFTDVFTDIVEDAYVVEAPSGRKAELPLFVLQARAKSEANLDSPAAPARDSNKKTEPTLVR